MRRHLASIMIGGVVALGLCVPAKALINRAWVSGKGVDSSGCGAPSTPCRSLQYVHDHIIAPGGEIDILDPAGYGAVTIAKALSIVNDGTGVAGVQQSAAGLNAVTINAGATDAVTLRGLNIDGLGVANAGVQLNSVGTLTIDQCVIRHFAGDGVHLQPSGAITFTISGTTSADNAGHGIAIVPTVNIGMGGAIHRAKLVNNLNGLEATTGGQAITTVTDTLIANNKAIGVHATSTQFYTGVILRNVTISNAAWPLGTVGVQADNSSHIVLGHSVVSGQFTAFKKSGTEILASYGDNDTAENNISGASLSVITPQ